MKLGKVLLALLGLFAATSTLAQVPVGRTTTTTLYEQYKPGVITFKNGKKSRHSKLNVFLKNSTLVFLQGNTTMEAIMPDIQRVEIEGKTYLNSENCLVELIKTDSVSNTSLVKLHTIDVEAWHAEALNNSIIDNLDYSANSRAINMTRTDNLVNPDSYPVTDTFFFLYKGKRVKADERSVRETLSRKKRDQLDVVIFDNFRWSEPDCLVRLLPLFQGK